MGAIGGYFELDVQRKDLYHHDAVLLNSGRSGLEYILRAKGYKKLLIPYFTCDVILQPLHRLGIDYEFYALDENLEPATLPIDNSPATAFLYTNYFGVKDDYITKIANHERLNLIVDNAQAFYSAPVASTDTFYSPRKFFGLPDGGLVYCSEKFVVRNRDDSSLRRMSHLLMRLGGEAEDGYREFTKNDEALKEYGLLGMSLLTEKLLCNINFQKVREIRITNFDYLHERLSASNGLKVKRLTGQVPMIYPYRTKDHTLRERLLKNRIYTPRYWPNVAEWTRDKSWEHQLTDEIISLPVDQRYAESDMEKILKTII